MDRTIIECIRGRRSVRTFSGSLSEDEKGRIQRAFEEMSNPFGVEVSFRLLAAKEHKLNSPVIVGAEHYVAAKVKRVPGWEIAFGYSFEKFAIQPSHPLSPLLLLLSIFPSIRIFSNESVLRIRWPKGWSFSSNISPSNAYSRLISFRID